MSAHQIVSKSEGNNIRVWISEQWQIDCEKYNVRNGDNNASVSNKMNVNRNRFSYFSIISKCTIKKVFFEH